MSDIQAYIRKIKRTFAFASVSVENTEVYVADCAKGFWALEVEIKNII